MQAQDLLFRLGIALAIGFLVGLERGWRDRAEKEGQRAAGIRTFSLTGILGGLAGALSLGGDRLLLSACLLTFGLTMAAFFWRDGEREQDFSATSLVAALLVLLLGAYAVLGDVRVAAALGVATTGLLAGKATLHGWLQRLHWNEIRSGLQLAAMTFIALPLLPQRAIDPWNALNPYQLWLATILLAAVSFAGYAASRIAGTRRGLLLAALLGGVFASTAVTLSLSRYARGSASFDRFLAGGILASNAVMLLRVVAICLALNAALASELVWLLGPAALGMAAASLAMITSGKSGTAEPVAMKLQNPFDLAQVLRFGLLLAAVSVAAVIARQLYGQAGLFSLAAISGLVDVDAITLSAARMPEPVETLARVIAVAAGVNTLAKSAYAGVIGGLRLGWLVLAGGLAAFACAAIVLVYQ